MGGEGFDNACGNSYMSPSPSRDTVHWHQDRGTPQVEHSVDCLLCGAHCVINLSFKVPDVSRMYFYPGLYTARCAKDINSAYCVKDETDSATVTFLYFITMK